MQKERPKRRSSGKTYVNSKSTDVKAKEEPSVEKCEGYCIVSLQSSQMQNLYKKKILFLGIYLEAKGYFDAVEQKYLVSDHSFLSCNRDFAQIEKTKRLEKCEVPMDLVRLMVRATTKDLL